MNDVLIAFGLTIFAGMATGIGSVIAFTARGRITDFCPYPPVFSAGVMLYISFVEIFYKGGDALAAAYGEKWGPWVNTASFFAGMFVIGIIDNIIPSAENPTRSMQRRKPRLCII